MACSSNPRALPDVRACAAAADPGIRELGQQQSMKRYIAPTSPPNYDVANFSG